MVPLPFRARSAEQRLALAQLLAHAPARVGVAGDGWAAAALRIAGRVPVWRGKDPTRAEEVLAMLGLPGLEHGACDVTLREDGRVRGKARPAMAGLRAAEGPLVTILICTYQRKPLVQQAIASALAQSWPCEVLVVNDGSTDGTAELLDQLAEKTGIRVVHQPNGGKPGALNAGIAAARGEAILVLDDDDLLLPGAVEVLARALFARPEAAAVYGDTVLFDGRTGRPIKVRPGLRLPPAAVARAVLAQVPFATGSVLVRTSAQRAAGEFDTRLTRGEDMDMFLRWSRVGDLVGLPLPVFLCRKHGGARGKQGQRFQKTDADANARFLAYAQGPFRGRWRQEAPTVDRAMGHAWALGLKLRGLDAEARTEAARWPGPHTLQEAWIRQQLGLPAQVAPSREALVVVDDGPVHALAALLEQEAAGRSLWISMEGPRDPLGTLQLHWPGHYAKRARLEQWVQHTGPRVVRRTSEAA